MAQPSIRPSVSTTACRLRPLTPAFAGAGSSWLRHSPPDRSGAPPFSPFHALTVHDGCRGTGLLARQLTGLFVEGVVQTPQRAVTLPAHPQTHPQTHAGELTSSEVA